jgi:acyl-CoA thioesterase-1
MKVCNACALGRWCAAVLLPLIVAASAAPLSHAATQQTPVALVAFGDSLTAGYGLRASDAFPRQLQMALEAKGHKVEILNAGVSGDTTAGGLERLDWALEPKPDGVILELGANDALRGTNPSEARANLDKMLANITSKGIDVLIAGMKAPNNWGRDYVKDFDAIYPDLATKYRAPLYPFFLEGIALDRSFAQADGLPPTAAGVAEIVKRILPDAEALVQRIEQRKLAGR